MNILKVVRNLRTRAKKNNGKDDKQRVDNTHPSLSFEERIEVLLWGDKKLGVKGIKGRMDKLEYLLYILLGISVLTAIALLDHLTSLHNGVNAGIVSKLLQGLVVGLLGG